MRISIALLAAVLIPAAALCTSAGPEALKEPVPPVKKVEEPVFKLPELVIIGENQARIMAQKEQLAGTPLKGLHEAPLLEKEESALTQMRRREQVPVRAPAGKGPFALVKVSGGAAGFFGAGAFAGRRTEDFMVGLDVSGSRWKGAPAGAGYAGGWDFSAFAMRANEIGNPGELDALVPSWFKFLAPFGIPDWSAGSIGWQGMGRELPYLGGHSRRAGRFAVSGDTSRSDAGYSSTSAFQHVTISSPVAEKNGWSLADAWRVPVADIGPVSVVSDLRAGYEGLKSAGKYVSGGAGISAAVIRSEKWRYTAGILADGVRAGGEFHGSLRPSAGISFKSPEGFNVASSYTGGLAVPSVAGQAFASPYACFSRMPAMERRLGELAFSVWRTIWDESGFGADYVYGETRNALSWFERPGEGLYEPAALLRLRVHEFGLHGRWNGWKPYRFFASAAWRAVSAQGGEAVNLPRGEGRAGAEWEWRALSAGAEVSVVRARFRSISGGELDPFVDFALNAAWKPTGRITLYGRADNLLGDTIERWGGYPDPKRSLSAGLLASF